VCLGGGGACVYACVYVCLEWLGSMGYYDCAVKCSFFLLAQYPCRVTKYYAGVLKHCYTHTHTRTHIHTHTNTHTHMHTHSHPHTNNFSGGSSAAGSPRTSVLNLPPRKRSGPSLGPLSPARSPRPQGTWAWVWVYV